MSNEGNTKFTFPEKTKEPEATMVLLKQSDLKPGININLVFVKWNLYIAIHLIFFRKLYGATSKESPTGWVKKHQNASNT